MASLKFDSFREYILFLYVHIALADEIVQEEEKELILKRLGKYFKEETNLEDRFTAMVEAYKENRGDVEKIIIESHEKFQKVEFYKKYKVYKDLYDIIEADGVIHDKETLALNRLKSLIGLEVTE